MSADPPRIWCNYPFQEPAARLLRAGTARHRLIYLERPAAGLRHLDGGEPMSRDAEILFGQPDPVALLSSPTLRWVQLTSAGYTDYDRDDVRHALHQRGATLTNSSRVFDEPCAATSRGHGARPGAPFAAMRGQPAPRTILAHARAARPQPGPAARHGETAFIYGFGAIARRLVEILAPLRMRLVGVRRAVRGDEGIPTVTTAQADERLGEADHVIDILPESESTHRFFAAERFARFKKGARFYNVGRGATVDQDALLAALRGLHVEAAYLDVTDPEPLPPGHALWHAPNCWITPHVAGRHADEEERLVRHFLANLEAFEKGRPLADRVM